MAKRVIFVGGGAGGLTCAVRLRRLDEKCEIIILEKSANVSVANCAFPYFIEGVVKERKDLIVRTPAFLMNRFNFDLRVNSEVISINRETKTVTVKETKEGGEERIYDVEYEKVVLSCGSDPICPPIPGIQNTPHIHFLRSLDDSDKLKLEFDHVKERMEKENKKLRVAMIGAGYIGMELTEALVHQGFDVTVFEYNKHVMGLFDEEMASPLNRLLIAKGVDLRLQTTVSEFSSFENQVRMKLSNGNELIADFVVVAIGAKPNSQICEKAGLNVGMRGAVRVDHQMRTSDPDIYAIGDQIELPHLITGEYANIQLAGPSNRQAHTAADSIAGRQSTYSGCQGTAICKIFDTTAALTGVSEREIKRSSNQEIKDYVKIYAYTANQVAYYPGSATIYMKLIFHRVSGRILGSQMIGMNGVDKRIDVIAVAVRKAMTVYDLEDLELAYAPPYNGPVDPVNNLGHIGANILRGDVEVWHFDEAIDLEKQFILDVRTAEENSRGAIPNSKLIPLDSLRAHIGEIDSSKEIMVYCQSGLRGYVASRLLSSLGFKCKNLSGGYLVYNNWKQLNPQSQQILLFVQQRLNVASSFQISTNNEIK